jgi:uncharacterized protein YcbK (DUF882 family)
MSLIRRKFLTRAFALTGGASLVGWAGGALAFPETDVRRLGFANLHTGETLNVAYWEHGAYLPDALGAVNHVLRDFRTGDVHAIEPKLLDLLVMLSGKVATRESFQVISGYRSPATNAALHELSSGVASKSLHMEGKAIDIRLAGVPLTGLRDAALGLGVGGVGYYPTSDFVHVDVGRPRRWSGA